MFAGLCIRNPEGTEWTARLYATDDCWGRTSPHGLTGVLSLNLLFLLSLGFLGSPPLDPLVFVSPSDHLSSDVAELVLDGCLSHHFSSLGHSI